MKATKGYITRGKSGWTVGLVYRETNTAKFFHSFPNWGAALAALQNFWNDAPDYQNGFPCEVQL